MDTYGLVAHGATVVVGGVTTAIGPFLGWVGDETVVDGGFPALAKAEKRAQNGRLRTPVRRSIIAFIAHLWLPESALLEPLL